MAAKTSAAKKRQAAEGEVPKNDKRSKGST